MNTDIVIIGAGPAGIFTAMELLRRGSKEKILLLEKGRSIETRKCPKAQTGRCMNCKPYCHITTGFSGAGAFSDGKLSLSPEVGGDLPQLIGEDTVQSLIEYTDSIYLEFGADTRVEGVSEKEAVKEIRKRAIQTGLKLVDCPIRHLGTEKAQEIYYAIEQYLLHNGVEIRFGCACSDLILKNDTCIGVHVAEGQNEYDVYAKQTVVAAGRRGAGLSVVFSTYQSVGVVAEAQSLGADAFDLILCDEPTSALDPLVADGILQLLLRLQRETQVSYLFITHDIHIVHAIADSVAVMFKGRLQRFGPKSQVLSPPFDDYTDLLLKSVPEMRLGWLEQALAERRMAGAGN